MKPANIELTKWFRSLMKHFGTYRGDPTTRELEVLAEVQGRIRLVIKTRWILLLLLCIYGVYAGGFFYFSRGVSLTNAQMGVLLGSLLEVIAYNLFFQRYYRELSHFAFINHFQILLDIFFVTILIHFSGGALSWFWTVYLVITLEAAFLLERKADVWAIGAVGGLIYGALLTVEFYHIIPHIL